MKKFSFTLIELLIVIAIIGILFTFLVPSLSKAREKARIAVCASQQKQIGFAITAYTSNNNGKIPFNNSLGNGQERTWDDRLALYDGREVPDNILDGWVPHSYGFEQYICPSDESPKHSARHKRSYSMTQGSMNGANTKRGIVQSTGATPWSMDIRQITNPSATLAVAENHLSNNKLGCNSGDTIRVRTYHTNRLTEKYWGHEHWRSNYLLIDNSVRFMKPEETFLGVRGFWNNENQVDTMWDSRK